MKVARTLSLTQAHGRWPLAVSLVVMGVLGLLAIGRAPVAPPDTVQTAAPPVFAARLPQPQVAPPVGDREPTVVPVRIEAKELIGAIDDSVAYPYWTFGGTVPGPMIRVRQGDTVELTLENAKESIVPHSIDLHAVTGPGGGSRVTQVAPGQSATFRFKALNPGVYVYHCATPPVPQHVANGMYGLIVVEPPGGLPPVDREFYVMQGDFYLMPNMAANGLWPFSWERMSDERPSYVLFNGAKDALTGERALEARVGDVVRIFFGVGGPNTPSSFHVVGEIFDRVAKEGASEWSTNVQTTLVPAGGAAIVEFRADFPGEYILVDHSLGRVTKGAWGVLQVTGPEDASIFSAVSAPGAALVPPRDPLH